MIALVLVVALAADPATDEAKRQFGEGKVAYDLAHFDDALSAFEAAYKAKPLPAFLFNIGQCHFQLAHYDRAAFFYERYLELMPDANNRELVAELLRDANAKRDEATATPLAAASKATPPTAGTASTPPATTVTSEATTTAAPTAVSAPPDEGAPWLWITSAGVVAIAVAAGAVVWAVSTSPQPPASTLGTLDRSRP